jgi:hypothetical protein
MVHFKESGLYETTDPQEQYYLDQHAGVLQGDEGKAEWDKMYLTPQQQLDKSNQKLADVQRQIKEQNALLDTVKERKGSHANASV